MIEKEKHLVNNLWFGYLAVFVLSAILYIATCAPGVLWQDSGLFQYRIWHNDLQGNLGLALGHPLYIMIGIAVKFIPLGSFAHRINLISAVFGAVAIANLFLLMRLWLDRAMPAVISAITLAVSWTFWQHTAIAEAYTLYAAQMLGELLVLLMFVRTKKVGYLYLLALFNGLAVANHMWGSFGFACYTVFLVVLLVRKNITSKNFTIAVLLWVIGALPYEYLVIKELVVTGDFAGTISSALFGSGWQGRVTNTFISAKIVFENFIFLAMNFPTPNVLLIFIGIWSFRKKLPSRAFGNIIIALAVLYFVFAFRYTVPDRFAFFLPFYCFAAMFAGIGADWLLQRLSNKKWACLVLCFAMMPACVYFFTPALGRKYYKSLGQRRQRPYRDEYEYFLKPWKTGDQGPERFARESLETVEQGAVLYAYTTDVHAILVLQESEGVRPDVMVVSDHNTSVGVEMLSEQVFAKWVKERPAYCVSPFKGYCPEWMLDKYDFEQVMLIYKVVDKK
jgi:hypothetical protein